MEELKGKSGVFGMTAANFTRNIRSGNKSQASSAWSLEHGQRDIANIKGAVEINDYAANAQLGDNSQYVKASRNGRPGTNQSTRSQGKTRGATSVNMRQRFR